MKETVDWLINLENDFATLFTEGAELFKRDKEFSTFLSSHAEDEKEHINALRKILHDLGEKGDLPSDFTLSEKKQAEVTQVLDDCKKKMGLGSLTKSEMLEAVIRAELSEFNPFLLYAVELIKERNNNSIPDIIDMQGHLNDLRQFVERQDGSANVQHLLNNFPEVWCEKILIVEECNSMRKLFMNMFESDELIECAIDANDAFEKIRHTYYSVIITEVNLASMNGIDFYRKALETDLTIGKRFLFITSDDSLENIRFFKKNGLRHLIKPAFVKDIRAVVGAMLSQRNASMSSSA